MGRVATLGIVGLAWVALAAPALAQNRPSTTFVLLSNFEKMVFDESRAALPWSPFRRWQEDVRGVVIGEGGEAHIDHVRGLFRDFQALTGLGFTLSEADSAANIEILFASRDWYRNATAQTFAEPRRVQCFTNTSMNSTGGIEYAFVVIPEDLSRREVETCLAHELMHTLGFAGHPDRRFDSALRSGNAAPALTVNDRILIRTYYDPAITAAMLREDMLDVARSIADELRNEVGRADDPMDVLTQRRPVELWWLDAAPA